LHTLINANGVEFSGNHLTQEDAMKRFIISTTFIVGLLSYSLSPALAAPSDHDLKTNKGVTKLFEENQQNSGGQ
jgi:hypothetical protein